MSNFIEMRKKEEEHGWTKKLYGEKECLERELGIFEDDVSMDSSKGYSYKSSVVGYTPEELNVDLDGNAIVIQGQHKSSGKGQTLERMFTRRFILPPDAVKEQIECNMNEKGLLEVVAPRVFIIIIF